MSEFIYCRNATTPRSVIELHKADSLCDFLFCTLGQFRTDALTLMSARSKDFLMGREHFESEGNM